MNQLPPGMSKPAILAPLQGKQKESALQLERIPAWGAFHDLREARRKADAVQARDVALLELAVDQIGGRADLICLPLSPSLHSFSNDFSRFSGVFTVFQADSDLEGIFLH